eukprot:PhM_4_TR13648/c0_g1_i2/m.32316/K18162/NDUFAF5; NADH dehydrogenase [ubiquinone] 1 alpha subcomplex assembly factor 5
MPSPISLTRSLPTRPLQGQIFDRVQKRLHRGRPMDMERMTLHKTLADQMLERTNFIKGETPVVLEIGAHCGWFLDRFLEHEKLKGVQQYIQCDISADRLNQNYDHIQHKLPQNIEFVQMECDEELSIPVPEKSVDMVVSCLSMHWVNNLEQAMINIRKVLKHDGFMIMCMFGGNTLYELRTCFMRAEQEREGGFSAHTNPMIDGAGMSTLMLQSGFHFPTVDLDRHMLSFPSAFHLMEYLQDMGENNCMVMRRPYMPPDSFVATAALYDYFYGNKETGLVPATFEVFHAIGWAPSPDRPVHTAKRGSGQISLQSLNSQQQKEFQDVLAKLGEDPNNEELNRRAEELLEEMSLKEDDHIKKGGMEEEKKAKKDDSDETPKKE